MAERVYRKKSTAGGQSPTAYGGAPFTQGNSPDSGGNVAVGDKGGPLRGERGRAAVAANGAVETVAPYGANESVTASGVSSASGGRVYKKRAAVSAAKQTERVYTARPEVKAAQVQNLQTWFNEAESLVRSTQEYVAANRDTYNREYGVEYQGKIDQLMQKADTVAAYLDYYQSDAEAHSALTTAFGEIKQYLSDFGDYTASMRDYYGNWDDEAAYNDTVAAAQREEELLAVDREALASEIQFTKEMIDLIAEYRRWENQDPQHFYGAGNHGAAEVNSQRYALLQKMSYYGITPEDKESLEEKLKEAESTYASATTIQEKARILGYADAAKSDPEYARYLQMGQNTANPTVEETYPRLSLFGWEPNGEAQQPQNPVTFHLENKQALQASAAAGGVPDFYDEFIFQMTDEQVDNYNYIFGKYGREEADKYLELMREDRKVARSTEIFEKYLENKWYEGVFSVVQGLDQFGTGLQAAFGNDSASKRTFDPQMVGAMVREDIGEGAPKVLFGSSLGQIAYDFGTTAANMLPSIGAGALANMVAPGSGAYVSTTLMGLSSGGNAYKDALSRGYTEEQARTYGVLVGTSEALLGEVLGSLGPAGKSWVGSALKSATDGIQNAAARFAIQLGGQMLSEAAEEGLQEILTPFFENIALDADNTWEDIDWEQAAYSALMGAMSAFAMEGGTSVASVAATYARQNAAYRSMGAQFVNGEGGVTIDDAITIGLSNAKGTDAYKAAVKIQQRVQAGQTVSPYAVGRMVAESQTEQAWTSRAIEQEALESGRRVGYDTEAVEQISQAAVALNLRVRFAAPGEMTNANHAGEYHAATDTVVLNSAVRNVEKLMGYVMGHETAHAVEGTKQMEALKKLAVRSMGAEGWAKAQADVREEYAAAGTTLSSTDVEREALADWVGNNLFKKGFVQAVVSGDATTGNTLLYLLDRVRRVFATKNSLSRNVAMLERLFMQAIEARDTRTVTDGEGVQGAIGYTEENRPVVIISEDILAGVPSEQYVDVAEEIIKTRFPNGVPVAGRLVKVNKLTRDEYTHSKNTRFYKSNDGTIYADKMRAAGQLDEIILASTNYINEDLNHARKDNFTQFARGDVLMRIGSRDYSAKVVIGFTSGNNMVLYDVVDFTPVAQPFVMKKETGTRSPSTQMNAEDSSNVPVSTTTVAQNADDVNTQSMPEGARVFTGDGGNGVQGALLTPDMLVDSRSGAEGGTTTPPSADADTSRSPRSGPLLSAEPTFPPLSGESPYTGEARAADSRPYNPDGSVGGDTSGGVEVATAASAVVNDRPVDGQSRGGPSRSETVAPYGADSGVDVSVDEGAVLEEAVRSTVQGKRVVEVDTSAMRGVEDVAPYIDRLERELGSEELLRRMYTAAQMHRPTGMVEVDGRRVDAGAYMDAYERSLPDDVAAVERHIERLQEQRTAEVVRMEQEGTLEDYRFGGLKIDLQLFAAQRKWDLLQLDAGEDGKKARQFYEKRLRGTDANHNQELVDMLAGRSETYNPIANEVTLNRAKDRLRDSKYQEKLLRRIGKYNPRDVFSVIDVAAAQVLINDAINDGELEVAADLIAGLSRKGTELGRAVQAFSMMARLTPEGTLRAALRTVKAEADYVIGEGANEGLDVLAEDLVRAIREAEEEGLSSDEIAARIRNGEGEGVEGAAPYGANSSADIHNMLAKIRSGDFKPNDKVEFGRVPDAIVERLREVTGTDVTGYKMVIEARILDHMLRDHGENGAADQSLADDADVARMGDVLANPDDIRPADPTSAYVYYDEKKGRNRPSPTVVYEKGEGDQSFYVIHTMADTKKKTLYVTTAFIGKPGYKKGAQQFTDGTTPGATSETAATGTPTDSIARGEGQVKAEVKMTRKELVRALTDDLAATEGTFLTRDDVAALVEKVVNDATNIPEQLKRYVLKQIRKDDGALAQRIYEVYKKGHLNNAALRRALEEALELPHLTTDDIEWVVKQGAKIESLKDKPVEQADAMDELYDYLGAKMAVNGWDCLQAWRKFGMLFNVKTHLRNVLSNAAYWVIRKADDAVAMAIERLFVRDSSQWGAALGWSHTEHGQSILPQLQERAELAVLEMQKRGAKYEGTGTGMLKQRRKYFGTSKAGEWFNRQNRRNSAWLEKEDIVFFRPAYIDALGQMMTARGVTEITTELHEMAMQRALEATFRADNMISDVISALKRFQNSTSTGKRLFGHGVDVVIPFHKTPANIAVQTVMHSPIGIVKGAFDLYNATRGKGSKDAATAINTMAKGFTGTALLVIGLLLGSAGLFNTGFGKTEKERAADEMAGLQEGSFVIGGVSVSLDWLQPAASPLIVGASIAERLREGGFTIGDVFGAVMDGTDSLFELTMLQSLYDILGGYDAGASGTMLSVGENVVSQSVPTLVGQLARAIDPVQRKTTGDNDFETIVNQVVARIPGLTYLLDPELDVWGNVVYRTGKPGVGTAVLNILQQGLIPANTKVGTANGDAISEEILRLYEVEGGAVIPTAVSRDEAAEADEDWVDLNQLLGGVNRLAVEEFMNNEKAYDVTVETGELTEKGNPQTKKETKYYRDMTDEERRKVLARIYKAAKAEVTGDTEGKTESQLTDSERYFRDLIRRVNGGERGTYDTAETAPAEEAQQASTSYFDDMIRRMRNGN